MKSKAFKALLATSLCTIILTSNVFAQSTNSNIPSVMEPGSVITFDENGEHQVLKGDYSAKRNLTAKKMYDAPIVSIPEGATPEEAAQIEKENELAMIGYNAIIDGTAIESNDIEIVSGMKVVYDDVTGELLNIYYVNENDPSGYSINDGMESTPLKMPRLSNATYTWGTNYTNSIVISSSDNSFTGVGRATYFTGSIGNRDNTLKKWDCATKQAYDFSKKGDETVYIRNLNTDEAFSFYQADVGGLPDAVIDIWGLSNLRTLAGNSNVTSVYEVRYYHKAFSDQ